jgi:hypothetical protein
VHWLQHASTISLPAGTRTRLGAPRDLGLRKLVCMSVPSRIETRPKHRTVAKDAALTASASYRVSSTKVSTPAGEGIAALWPTGCSAVSSSRAREPAALADAR